MPTSRTSRRLPSGALYACWLDRSGAGTYTYEVRLARSTEKRLAFALLGVLHDDRSSAEHGFVSAVREGAGLRFYYLDGRATPGDEPMQLRTVVVEGTQIAPSELVDESVCDCCATSAVALAGGASAVAYRDRTAAEIRDVQVALRPVAGAAVTKPVGNDGWKIAGCPVTGPALFNTLLVASAAYVAWIGLSLVRSGALFDASGTPEAAGAAAAVALSTAYRRGMLTNLLNPKAYAFMLAVFPQFVRREWGPVWLQAALLGAIIVATQFSVYGAIVLAAARARGWLAERPQTLALIGRSVGLLLLAVALFSAIEGWRSPG